MNKNHALVNTNKKRGVLQLDNESARRIVESLGVIEVQYNESRKSHPTSISGRYRFGFQTVRISPASLKHRLRNEIFLQSKNFILNLGVITVSQYG